MDGRGWQGALLAYMMGGIGGGRGGDLAGVEGGGVGQIERGCMRESVEGKDRNRRGMEGGVW